jgi:hypothetical protein
MTTIVIEDNTPEGKWLLELIKNHRSVTVIENEKKTFRQAVSECNGRPVSEFFDEMSRQAKERMSNNFRDESLRGNLREIVKKGDGCRNGSGYSRS